jgi:hypothetical protein
MFQGATCGTGVMERTVSCVSHPGANPVPMAFCSVIFSNKQNKIITSDNRIGVQKVSLCTFILSGG